MRQTPYDRKYKRDLNLKAYNPMNILDIKKFLLILATLFALLTPQTAKAQIIPVNHQHAFTDSLRDELINAPYFTLFKDNYFTVGTTVGKVPNKHNSDVKFQL
ncbi:MAG: hypothetical protein K2K97_03065, partial [Muribaculaceae bacterium]|nr:hypothetical protein [Muribaculaceae bacterium]